MAKDPIPEAWKNVPSIGAKAPGQEQQGPPQPFQFMGIGYPPDFIEGMITLVTVPNHGDFYTNAPVAIEPGIVGLVQAFAYDSEEEVVIQYRLLTFIDTPGIASYLVKPPEWWATDVLAKKTELPE